MRSLALGQIPTRPSCLPWTFPFPRRLHECTTSFSTFASKRGGYMLRLVEACALETRCNKSSLVIDADTDSWTGRASRIHYPCSLSTQSNTIRNIETDLCSKPCKTKVGRSKRRWCEYQVHKIVRNIVYSGRQSRPAKKVSKQDISTCWGNHTFRR